MSEAERRFPILQSREAQTPHPMSVPWGVAELAYSVYVSRFGKWQSLDRIAERGGFHSNEMDDYLPDWREQCSELATLRAENERLRKCFNVLEIGVRRGCTILGGAIFLGQDTEQETTIYQQAKSVHDYLRNLVGYVDDEMDRKPETNNGKE